MIHSMQPICRIVLVLASTQAASPPLTVDDAVRAALSHNPGLRAARHVEASARADADRAKPVPRPALTADAGALLQGPSLTFPRGAHEATVVPTRSLHLRITAEQPVYRAGVGDAWRLHSARLAAATAQTDMKENDLIRDVRKAYLTALSVRALREVADEARELAAKHAGLVRRMVEAGLAAPRDVMAADADLAEAEDGAVQARNGAALALGNLERLIGLDRPLKPDSLVEPVPASGLPAEDQAVALARTRRPEIAALRHGIAAAKAGCSLARTQTQPLFSLRAATEYRTPSAFVSREWASIGLLMVWPILDAGKGRADTMQARARLGELEATLDEALAGVALEVRGAWAGITSAEARIGLSERRMAAARSALEVSEIRYEQRAATLLEVSAARLAVSRAGAALTQARSDLLTAQADLRHAVAADLDAARPASRPHSVTEEPYAL
jgi:outer membrane protein